MLDRRTDALRIIRRSGEHLAALVEGLLDISRIEAKRIDIYRDEVALPEFLAQLVDMFRLQAREKGIGFVFDPPARMPARVHTDEHRLRQVLINLLSNAIKFTQAGTVTLRVRWRTEVAEFDVIDTGIGIAAPDLDRIFEPLQRVSASRAAAVPGMGLGLTIAKVLTEIMGGEISVSSHLGEGSRFRVRLLLSETVGAVTAAGRSDGHVSGYLGDRRRIVVVDDDPLHRALMLDLLAPLGFTVLALEDGPACLTLAAAGGVDLFLIDLSMPGMNGWVLAEALRQMVPTTPIVIITADGRELKDAPTMPHHDDTMTKPVEVAGLLDRIGRLLRLEWVEAAAAAHSPGAALSGDQLAKLRDMAAIGHVSGLRTQLDVFEREGAEVAALRSLLADYQLEAFIAALGPAA